MRGKPDTIQPSFQSSDQNFIRDKRFSESQVCCFPLWIISIYSMYHCQNLLNDACRGCTMSCAAHLGDVLCWQGLNCQQIFTLRVWKREHGLLIMFRDSSMHIPNIASLNTALLKAKSSFTWHPLPCWMSHCVKLHESPFWADLWKHVPAYSNLFFSHILVFELVVVSLCVLIYLCFLIFIWTVFNIQSFKNSLFSVALPFLNKG